MQNEHIGDLPVLRKSRKKNGELGNCDTVFQVLQCQVLKWLMGYRWSPKYDGCPKCAGVKEASEVALTLEGGGRIHGTIFGIFVHPSFCLTVFQIYGKKEIIVTLTFFYHLLPVRHCYSMDLECPQSHV